MEQRILLTGKSINGTQAGFAKTTSLEILYQPLKQVQDILDKRSNVDYAANAFIRAYIDEVSRIKKRGTRKQKLTYLFRKKKDITLKDVYELVSKQIKK